MIRLYKSAYKNRAHKRHLQHRCTRFSQSIDIPKQRNASATRRKLRAVDDECASDNFGHLDFCCLLRRLLCSNASTQDDSLGGLIRSHTNDGD